MRITIIPIPHDFLLLKNKPQHFKVSCGSLTKISVNDGLLTKALWGRKHFASEYNFIDDHVSVVSEIVNASSISTPKYSIVLSNFEWPKSSCIARRFFVLA